MGDFFMRVRLGYACICESLDNVTSSTNYTYTAFLKEQDYSKLDSIIRSNLEDLEKIIDYNIKNDIHFYRLSSKLIPLATKDDVLFDYIDKYRDYYDRIGGKINKSNMRVDFHPDQFCVLNSVNSDVVSNSIKILKYHYLILDALRIKNKVLVLHVGSNAFGKKNSLSRFIKQFLLLPDYLRECIAIENDDKVFNIEDCLYLNSVINVPIILDYHHHLCNHEKLELDFSLIFKTWKDVIPKVHCSSPKNKTKKDFRSHHDYIDPVSFVSFLDLIKDFDFDVDIMIEAKKKDEALFRLVRNIKYLENYKFLDDTTFFLR